VQLAQTFVNPPPDVPFAEVAMLTPPYSVTVPAVPTLIVIVGEPDPFAWAEAATKYQVFALITPPDVQKLVPVEFVPPHATQRSPALLRPTRISTEAFAPAESVLNTGIARPYWFCIPVPVGDVILNNAMIVQELFPELAESVVSVHPLPSIRAAYPVEKLTPLANRFTPCE
jgi:hypothetical protein